jgi:ADP-heptose:LPS heptosyltransferase
VVASGHQVLLVSGPADRVSSGVVQHEMQGAPITRVADQPLPLVAAILERCAAYVGNDSGITHLAASVGVPVVAIFGPTDPALWAPQGTAVTVLHGSAATETLQKRSLRSLEDITVETAITALETIGGLRVQ